MSLEEKVKNQYIVKIRLPIDEINALAKKLEIPYCEANSKLWSKEKENFKKDLENSGARIICELKYLNGYVIKVSPEKLLEILKKPYIAYVEKNRVENFIPEK